MIGYTVKFTDPTNTEVIGQITDITNHENGSVSFEILQADKKRIHYLTKNEFTVWKSASLETSESQPAIQNKDTKSILSSLSM